MTRPAFLRRRPLRWFAILSGVGVVSLVLISWWVGSRLTAPARMVVGPPPAGLDFEEIVIPRESGPTLRGWYLPGDPAQGTVVLLHGIRGSRLQMVDRARLFHDEGYATLLIDLQAHGESEGEHITAGYLERLDVAAAVQLARRRKPNRPVAVVGASLGAAATLLASPLDIDAFVAEAVYPTIEEAIDNRVRSRLGFLSPLATQMLLIQLKPRLGVSTSQLRPIDYINKIGCPLLIISGSDDRYTTRAETERLFQAAREPKQLEIFSGAAHVDLHHFDPEKYAGVVVKFLKNHLPSATDFRKEPSR